MPTGFPFSTHFKLCNVFSFFTASLSNFTACCPLWTSYWPISEKLLFLFQIPAGFKAQVAQSSSSWVWMAPLFIGCLLEASYSPAPGSARSPVFSLNVNIRPHLAPGVTPPTSKIRLRIFLSDQLYEVRAGSGDPERSASTILFTSTRTQVQKILVSDGDSWFFVIVKTRPQRICITMHQLPCTPGSGTTGIITQPLCFQLCRQLNTNQGWSLSLLITSSSFFVYHQISGRGCWNNDTSFS